MPNSSFTAQVWAALGRLKLFATAALPSSAPPGLVVYDTTADVAKVCKNDGVTFTTLGGGPAASIVVGNPVTGGGANRVLFEDAAQNLATDTNFTYDGTNLVVAKAAGFNVAGTQALPAITLTSTNRGLWQTTSGNYNGIHVSSGNGTDQVVFPTSGSGAGTGVAIRSDGLFEWAGDTANPIATAPDTGLARDAAGVVQFNGGVASTTKGAAKIMGDANGSFVVHNSATELLTLSTIATTTDTAASLLPQDAIIDAVLTRVTTTITTAATFSVGDPTTGARFSASAAGIAAGSTRVGIDHWSGAVTTLAAGPSQAAAAKVRITTNVNPGAGVIRITVIYHQFVAPTS